MANTLSKLSILKKFDINNIENNTIVQLQNYFHIFGIKEKGMSRMRKAKLIETLKNYVNKQKSSIIICNFIEKHIYNFFNKIYLNLREEYKSNKNNCVNETDFYTFEPIVNIPDNQFFAYNEKDVYYGFNIFSLKELIYRNKKALNPYTREIIPPNIIEKIHKFIKIINILEPNVKDVNKEPIQPLPITNTLINNLGNISNTRFLGNNIYPTVTSLQQTILINKLMEIRKLPIEFRVKELFREMDLLGNYTNYEWFTKLERSQYIRFYNQLQHFWENRLSQNVKFQICSLTGTPFYNIFITYNFTTELIREACLIVMENLVYTGIDEESQKLGAIHILIHLSFVSDIVRRAIPWLL